MNGRKTVMVTGASGFIGRRLCSRLQEKGFKVRALMRNAASGPWDETVVADISTGPLPPKAMTEVSTVYHLAGKAHALAESPAEEESYRLINVEGTRRVYTAALAAGVGRFVFFSSIKAMGEGGDTPLDENCPLPPKTPYGRSKLAAEKLVLTTPGIAHVTVLRPTMVYGPGNPGNLGKMISAVNHGFFPPFPKIHNRRSMVHVDDLVESAILAATHPEARGETFIITDGNAYSTRQIYEWINMALGKNVPAWSVPLVVLKALGMIGDIIGTVRGERFIFDSDALEKLAGSAVYDSNKIVKELGFTPRRHLREALPSIVKSCIS